MDLLSTWTHWRPGSAPYILPEDQAVVSSLRGHVTHDWDGYHQCPKFGAPGDKAFHFGLLPHPYCGDVANASIYVLMLNPGVGPTDYFGEYHVPGYRDAVLANLRQDFCPGVSPFMFLDPRYAWHGGFGWWHDKLDTVIQKLTIDRDMTFSEARAWLATKVASIELVPYHSKGFRNEAGVAKKLPSAQLAKSYVTEVVLPRVRAGDAIVIVARKVRIWDLPDHRGVIKYTGGQSRGAHLGENSRGGKAILEHLRTIA